MAKVNLSFFVSEVRGKLDAVVYSRNRSGAYARPMIQPPYVDTFYTRQVRNEFGRLSQLWSQIPEYQRLTWDSAVTNFPRTNTFGDKEILTGKALFQSLNMNLFLVGINNRISAPKPEIIINPVVNAFHPRQPTNVFVQGSFPSTRKYLGFSTPAISPAINFTSKFMKLITAGDPQYPYQFDFGQNWIDRFGPRTPGMQIAIKIISVNPNTGQRGSPQLISAIIAP